MPSSASSFQSMPAAPRLPLILDETEERRYSGERREGSEPAPLSERLHQVRMMQQHYLDKLQTLACEHEASIRAYQPLLKRPSTNASDVRLEDAIGYWKQLFGGNLPPLAILFWCLCECFVKHVVQEDPPAMAKMKGRSVLYLANHQVAVESVLFEMMCPAWSELAVLPLSRIEHQQSWLGRLVEFNAFHPRVYDPEQIAYFDRQDRASLLTMVASFRQRLSANEKSLLVHVEGEQNRRARKPIERMSSLWIDLAIGADVPIVPVRFAGGLPFDPVEGDRDFPIGYGRQDYYLGRPIWPDELQSLAPPKRKGFVMERLNTLGPALDLEQPSDSNPELAARIQDWQERLSIPEPQAVCLATLDLWHAPTEEIQAILDFARGEQLDWDAFAHGDWLAAFCEWLCRRSG